MSSIRKALNQMSVSKTSSVVLVCGSCGAKDLGLRHVLRLPKVPSADGVEVSLQWTWYRLPAGWWVEVDGLGNNELVEHGAVRCFDCGLAMIQRGKTDDTDQRPTPPSVGTRANRTGTKRSGAGGESPGKRKRAARSRQPAKKAK